MFLRKFFCTVGLLLSISFSIQAQITIQGRVTDAETGETLPAANMMIEGSYKGTITNQSGEYSLSIPDSLLPATLAVRFIGYNPQTRVISRSTPSRQDFALTPAVTELNEIVVTDENPAVRIMREVIRRKQQWRKQLETYRAEAYTRQTLANDTSIVSITESTSTLFWDREQGHREILQARRQTANIADGNNFAGVSYMPNFYDDNITIAGYDLVGVTHPEALQYYDFKLEEQTSLGERTVFKISVIPARRLQPLFKGTIFVLDEEYALLEVQLEPNEVVNFPSPIQSFNSSYQQQFNNYGQNFWLPVDMRIGGDIKVSMMGLTFPNIHFKQVSRITNYHVNITLPDSIYREEEIIRADSSELAADSLEFAIPLSVDERQAYATIDSSASLEEAFKPSGFLARFIDDEEDKDQQDNRGERSEDDRPSLLSRIPGSFSPLMRFNRVDELFGGLRYNLYPASGLELFLDGGYSTGYRDWSYGAGGEWEWLDGGVLSSSLGIHYRAETATQNSSPIYAPYFTIIPNLLGNTNYFDYYRREGYRVFTQWELPRDLSAAIGFSNEDHFSLPATSGYDLLGQSSNTRPNPAIDEGHLQALDVAFGYNLDEDYNYGVTGQRYLRVALEHSSPELGSDFDYTRYEARLSWSFPTFYKRRLMPNTLDIGLKAGTFSGRLPQQKPGTIDGALGIFSPYGILRSLRNHPYKGEQYLALHMEHNFRTIPFELLGLRPLVQRDVGLILFGGLARTWGSARFTPEPARYSYGTGGLHWEAGVSLNRILGLFRLDLAARLDEPALLVNIGVARLF